MESETPEATFTGPSWGNCSIDILMLIFQRLEIGDLFSCMSVNRWWRTVVDYAAQHEGQWADLAKRAMVNKGVTFKRKSKLGWRELYLNSRLWRHLGSASVQWKYVDSVEDVKFVHLYKDNLIIINRPECRMTIYKINGALPEVVIPKDQFEKPLVKNTDVNSDGRESTLDERTSWIINNRQVEDEEVIAKKMIEKLVHEGPFKRILVIEDGCFYMLDKGNVLRHYVWNASEGNWVNLTLARYYGCDASISDIHIGQGDVFLLRNCGTVMKLDREGRNFVTGWRFDMPFTMQDFIRLMHGDLRLKTRLERPCKLPVPQYGTGKQVLFQHFNAIVSVPREQQFKMNACVDGHRVIECPGLTCATQHGEVLFLGYDDGKVEICMSDTFIKRDGLPEIQVNVQDYEYYMDSDPSIVGLEVYEDVLSHLLYVATRSSVYKLVIKYPEEIKQNLGFV